jgi:hypothetical protein
MGYELKKLMRQFGVSTPGAVNYSGPAAPVIPVAPAGARPTGEDDAAKAGQAAYDKQLADANAYKADPSAFNEMARKYNLAQKEYDQYKNAYTGRLMNTPQYSDAQFQTGPSAGRAYVSATPNIPTSISAGTEDQKRGLYQNLRDQGFSDTLIRKRAEEVLGPQLDPYWNSLTSGVVSTNPTENKGIGVDKYNQNIRDYFANNPNAVPFQVREAMDKYGISGYDVAQARGGSMWGNALSAPTYGAVPLSLGSKTQQEKTDYYNNLRNLGYTDADIRGSAESSFGKIPDADWNVLRGNTGSIAGQPGVETITIGGGSQGVGASMPGVAGVDAGAGWIGGTGGGNLGGVNATNSNNPYGFIAPAADSINSQGFVDYHNPTTGQTWSAPSSGWTAPSGWLQGQMGTSWHGAAKGGAVRDLTRKYAVGGEVRKFQRGGAEGELEDPMEAFLLQRGIIDSEGSGPMPMPAVEGRPMSPPVTRAVAPPPVEASPAVRPVMPPASAPTPMSPAANDLASMLNRYLGQESTYGPELAAARKASADETKAFTDMIAGAMKERSAAPDKTEMYFRLAAAFGAPTKTGNFAENLGMVGKELGEYSKDIRAAKKADRQLQLQLGLEAQKLRAQTAREDLGTLRTLTGEEMKDKRAILQEYLKSGRPQSEAGKAAVDAGLTQGTPDFKNFVEKYINDKIVSGNLVKEAMVQIAAGNLSVAQSRETRAQESSGKLTPAEVKLKSEAETALGSLDDTMSSLKRAYSLNPNTFDGTLAATAQLKVLEQTNPKDPRVLATREQRNLLGKGALSNLKAVFGGNPTEGERTALMELEGLDSKSKEERATIIRNTYKLVQMRRAREQKRLDDVAAGLYRETTPSATGDLD